MFSFVSIEFKEMMLLLKLLFVFSFQSSMLALICYNFGVDSYYREEYENCIGWLR